ncbi:MAG: ribonuclease J [Ruminococcaceae bacterium]|nr:ribonuclease J [Oscillospiraceae bacterium]
MSVNYIIDSGGSEVEKKALQSIKGNLRIIPLGGLGEIGKNLTVFESDNEIIIIDCGVAFPEGDMLGIDAVIPDTTYLTMNAKKIKGIFLTHGHEDHIGALPYFLKDIDVPIYGTKLTIALVEKKLEEHNLKDRVSLQVVDYGTVIVTNDFFVEFIRTNHSIADAAALAIKTPAGMVIHTGDFKVDFTPIDGLPIDLTRFAELSEEGVLLLMADSTNAEKKGFTMSERTVGRTFDELFANIKGRAIVATFSSNIHRVQQIIDTALKFNRKCVICGRSMVNVVDIATQLGYMKNTEDVIIDIEDMDDYPPEELCIITTGSQGEPMSALTRMAISTHRQIDIIKGDTVIVSASPIPGNEKPIAKMINELFKKGANVIYKSISEVHVSGHACEEELKIIQSIVKPKYFLPVHGEYKHLVRNKDIALKLGMDEENIFIIENGDVLSFGPEGVGVEEKVTAGNILIDGLGVGDVGNIVLRDRKHLSEDGLIIVVMTIDLDTGALLAGPDIISRGFVYMREAEDLMTAIREVAREALLATEESKRKHDWSLKKSNIRDAIHEYVYAQTKRNPMVLPIIMEVSMTGEAPSECILPEQGEEE